MRRKKQKHTRRTVSFYKVNYNLHEPFKVLLDGNFIHATLNSGLGDLDKHLSDLLGGRVKTFVTPCVMHELRNLGPEFKSSTAAAQQIKLHYCGHGKHGVPATQRQAQPGMHDRKRKRDSQGATSGAADGAGQGVEAGDGADEGAAQAAGAGNRADEAKSSTAEGQGVPLPAAECILSQTSSVGNTQHWWVATQDKVLREKLAQAPGMPVLFATANGIHLETPSEMTKAVVKEAEDKVMSLPEHERRSDALKDLEDIRPKLRTTVKFRRNKAKGPNPLASKKKVSKPPPQAQKPKQEGAEEGEKKKRQRRRQRTVDGADSGKAP